MATPLLLYLMNEASSGTTPTTVGDTSTGTALNLTITYGGGSWTSIGAGRGLTFTSTAGAVSAALNGTKVATALGGSTVATLEFVADTTNYTGFNEFGGLNATGSQDVFTVLTGSAGVNQVGIGGAAGSSAWFDVTPGLHHFLAVQDNTQATAANRLKLYVDGVLASVNSTPFAPVYPTLNQAIDATFTNYANNTIGLGCLTSAGTQAFIGPIYFFAVYASALSQADASAHSAALLSNNDADPNSAAASTIPFRRRPFDVSSWDDPDPSPPRRRVSPRAMPAAAAALPFRRSNIDWNQFYEPTLYYQGTRSALVQPGPPGPPGFTRPWLAAAASAWEPEAPPFVRARLFPPPSAAPLATSNPFTRPWLLTALDTWTPEYPAPATRLHYPRAVSAGPPTPPVPPTQPTNTGPFDWRADYAAIIGQMFRGGSFPFQT